MEMAPLFNEIQNLLPAPKSATQSTGFFTGIRGFGNIPDHEQDVRSKASSFDAAIATTTHHMKNLENEVEALIRLVKPGGAA